MRLIADEEIGDKGMESFVKTDEFKKLNVGCVIDESMPGETDEFLLAYAERSSWRKYC